VGLSREAWLDVFRPVAEGIAARDAVIEAMAAADQQRKAGARKAFAASVQKAEQPHQLAPFDPEVMRLAASIVARGGPEQYMNGAPAPEGGR
jgi:hypothetical protein